jgi:hypothetical protein
VFVLVEVQGSHAVFGNHFVFALQVSLPGSLTEGVSADKHHKHECGKNKNSFHSSVNYGWRITWSSALAIKDKLLNYNFNIKTIKILCPNINLSVLNFKI